MEKSCNLLLYSAVTRMLPSMSYIKKCFKINPQTAKVLFVPFADTENKYYLALCKQALMLAGIQKSNISTLSSHTHKTSKFDIIFVIVLLADSNSLLYADSICFSNCFSFNSRFISSD